MEEGREGFANTSVDYCAWLGRINGISFYVHDRCGLVEVLCFLDPSEL